MSHLQKGTKNLEEHMVLLLEIEKTTTQKKSKKREQWKKSSINTNCNKLSNLSNVMLTIVPDVITLQLFFEEREITFVLRGSLAPASFSSLRNN